MARENRQKRHERRFGKAERLADKIRANGLSLFPWSLDGHYDVRHRIEEFRSYILDGMDLATMVVADNVAQHVDESPKEEWLFEEHFPSPIPPWKHTFIEFARTPYQSESMRSGAYIYAADPDEHTGVPPRFLLLTVIESRGVVFGPTCAMSCSLAEDGGRISDVRHSMLGGDRVSNSKNNLMGPVVTPALLALSFMHCKNVLVSPVEPNAALNRERQRHGLKPFLRYHTINIEPMKAVLRTEGNIETEGLKRALHICRGHFATYSEERPLFGRVAGTFWVPAHVRGSAKQGVVVSDYNVKAPASV